MSLNSPLTRPNSNIISIENADYLPTGAFVTEPEVGNGSVTLRAAALTGTGEGDGTLAVAMFKVLTATETTIGLAGGCGSETKLAQPIAIASITGRDY